MMKLWIQLIGAFGVGQITNNIILKAFPINPNNQFLGETLLRIGLNMFTLKAMFTAYEQVGRAYDVVCAIIDDE